MTALGQLILERLEKLDMDRFALAKRMHITPVSVSAWIRDDYNQQVPWFHYPALATILEVPLARILKAAQEDAPERVEQYKTFIRWQKTTE